MKTALAFSGGRDSWACLWLNASRLSEILVIWVNPGKNYPEALAMIDLAKSMCPNWLEVKTNREAQNAYEGLPSDVVPIAWTRLGQQVTKQKPVSVQSYLGCCFENIAGPLHAAAKANGITHLIRGQRLDEAHKSPARDGDLVEGITYLQPIETWTRDEVMAHLATKMEIPDHFAFDHSSLDCYDCTAYVSASRDRVGWMKEAHPALYAEYETRHSALSAAIQEAVNG